MSNRNRGLFAALAGIALCQAAYGQDEFSSTNQAANEQAEIAASEAQSVAVREAIADAAVKIEGALSDRVTETGQTQSQRDLQAQEDMAFWALVMALAAVATFFVSVYVARIVQKTLQATAAAADHAKTMAEEAQGATKAAMEAAKAGREANEIARVSSERQLRAYVTTEDHAVTGLFRGGPAIFQLKIWNRGQTPAHDVRVWSIVTGTREGPDAAKIHQKIDENFHQSSSLLGPGQWFEHSNGCQGPLSNESYLAIMTGHVATVFAGVVTYRDIFGRRRFTTFKYFYRGSGDHVNNAFDLAACGRGNIGS